MKAGENQNLETILESAVVQNWPDLMPASSNGLIHLEYGFIDNGTLDHLQVWTSESRGYWRLACSYWMSASKLHASGVLFDNGYRSEGLARSLSLVMEHQNAFVLPRNFGRRGRIEITPPTEQETTASAAMMSGAADRVTEFLVLS